MNADKPEPGLRAPESWCAELALAGVTFIWGSTFVLVKSALADVSTILFLALRFSLAACVLGAAYRGRLAGSLHGDGAAVRGGVAAGFFLFTGYVLQTFGLRLTTPSKSAFLTGLAIVLVPLLGAAVYRVAPQFSEILGVALATIGMALMTLEGANLEVNAGDLLTVGCALAFAIHILILGHYAPRTGFEVLSVVQVATAATLALAAFWWAEPARIRWTPTLLAALAVTALLATALAFTVQAWAQQRTTPTRTALIFSLEPVFAWGTSYFVADEILPARAAAGALLILGGILTAELKPIRRGKHR